MTTELSAFARAIPKAELHVHLEGTISPQAYRRIAERNGIDAGDAESLFACHDFGSFLRAFMRVVGVLRRPEDFAEVAEEYIERAAADDVRHAEIFLSPATQRRFVPDLDLEQMVRAAGDACARAAERRGMTYALIFDMVRNVGEEEALRDVELALRTRGSGVVGIGLGGDERDFPARGFERAYARAASAGLRRTVHAGEAAGHDSILDAIHVLGAERIGHGVAAKGHPEVLRRLRERGVAIDACPTSNECTRAVEPGEPHPMREFLDAGVVVTLNSDDPAFFGATIGDEYAKAAATGLSGADIAALARNSFAASFLDDAQKRRRVAEVDAYCAFAGMMR